MKKYKYSKENHILDINTKDANCEGTAAELSAIITSSKRLKLIVRDISNIIPVGQNQGFVAKDSSSPSQFFKEIALDTHQRITKVMLSCCILLSISDISPLLTHPAIANLEFENCNFTGETANQLYEAICGSDPNKTICYLSITDSLNNDTLIKIARDAKHLKSLKISFYNLTYNELKALLTAVDQNPYLLNFELNVRNLDKSLMPLLESFNNNNNLLHFTVSNYNLTTIFKIDEVAKKQNIAVSSRNRDSVAQDLDFTKLNSLELNWLSMYKKEDCEEELDRRLALPDDSTLDLTEKFDLLRKNELSEGLNPRTTWICPEMKYRCKKISDEGAVTALHINTEEANTEMTASEVTGLFKNQSTTNTLLINNASILEGIFSQIKLDECIHVTNLVICESIFCNIEDISPLLKHPSIRELTFNNCTFSKECKKALYNAICGEIKSKRINKLNFNDCNVDNEMIIKIARDSRYLQSLYAPFSPRNNDLQKFLISINNNPYLMSVRINIPGSLSKETKNLLDTFRDNNNLLAFTYSNQYHFTCAELRISKLLRSQGISSYLMDEKEKVLQLDLTKLNSLELSWLSYEYRKQECEKELDRRLALPDDSTLDLTEKFDLLRKKELSEGLNPRKTWVYPPKVEEEPRLHQQNNPPPAPARPRLNGYAMAIFLITPLALGGSCLAYAYLASASASTMVIISAATGTAELVVGTLVFESYKLQSQKRSIEQSNESRI